MQTAPTPERATLVLAPVSPAIAKLLHQLQAQIIREAGDQRAPDDGFRPMGERLHTINTEYIGFRVCNVLFAQGEIRLQTETCTDPATGARRTGIWYGAEQRTDDQGRYWSRSLGDHVIDDFGTLVPVREPLQ